MEALFAAYTPTHITKLDGGRTLKVYNVAGNVTYTLWTGKRLEIAERSRERLMQAHQLMLGGMTANEAMVTLVKGARR
jgi:hypothetical protein